MHKALGSTFSITKNKCSWGIEAHICNPCNHLGSRDRVPSESLSQKKKKERKKEKKKE
jgi:hypothetical protein